jgi:lysophospholipase L1-like esterase
MIMINSKIYYAVLLNAMMLFCAKSAAQSYKFDLGAGQSAAGYTKVTPADLYNCTTGFGFEPGAVIRSTETKNGKGVYKDFVSGKQPFFFSVRLAEGNYDVKIFLGDAEGFSATTVRAENRRLFLQHVTTRKNELKEISFTVHIRDSIIRNAGDERITKVKLKPREIAYAHWDDKLTLEFNDSLNKICGIEIVPNKKAITVFLAGNSTVVDQDKEPWAAWGQMFPSFFEGGNISVANYAESGETLKAFRGEKRLDKIWSMARPGDYLFIEFAHNDQKPGGSYLDPFTTYKSTLKEWIREARSRKIVPVLVTSMHRRNFDAEGSIINTLSDYPKAMRQTAKEEGVAMVDLNAMSKILYEAWGPERSLKAFVHFPANTFPGQDSALKDNTHFTTYGAYELARCVVQSLKENASPLAKYLKKDIVPFNPAKPDEWQRWYWPLSQPAIPTRPEGN